MITEVTNSMDQHEGLINAGSMMAADRCSRKREKGIYDVGRSLGWHLILKCSPRLLFQPAAMLEHNMIVVGEVARVAMQ